MSSSSSRSDNAGISSSNLPSSNDSELVIVDGRTQARGNGGSLPPRLSIHGTGISQASSTPLVGHQQNQIQDLMRSNLSSILLTPPARNIRSRSREEAVSSTTDQRVSYISTSTEDSSSNDSIRSLRRTVTPRRRTNLIRREWEFLKPTKTQSLYYLIVNHPNDLDIEVRSWIELYNSNSEAAICQLLQLFIDICGFENVDVASFYHFDFNFADLQAAMLENIPEIQKSSAKYLFKLKTLWAIERQNHVHEFIRKLLIAQMRHDIFYNIDFLKHYLYLFLSLFTINLKSTVSTCGYLIAKIYTTTKNFMVNIEEDLNSTNMGDEDRDVIQTKKHLVLIFTNSLIQSLKTALGVMDASRRDMFEAIMEEIQIWFKMNLSIIFNNLQDYMEMINSVICKPTTKLRKAALNACKEFIKIENFKNYLTDVELNKFLTVVGNRLTDIDPDIAVNAIYIHIEIIKRDPTVKMLAITKGTITSLLYHPVYRLAINAGKLYGEILSLNRENHCDTLSMITYIINLHQTAKVKRNAHMSLLLESLMPYVPELKYWEFITCALIQDGLPYNEGIWLVELFTESFKQFIKGKGPRMAQLKTKETIDKYEYTKALRSLKIRFIPIYKRYCNDLNCARQLCSILSEIGFENVDASTFISFSHSTLGSIKEIFLNNNDETVLSYLSQYFVTLMDNLCPYSRHTKLVVFEIKNTIVERSMNLLLKIDENQILNKEETLLIENSFLKLVVFFVHHNLLDHVDFYFILNKVTALEENITSKMKIYMFKCCLLYLNHNLKVVIENSDNINNDCLVNLCNKSKCFIEKCFAVMSTTEVSSVKYAIFQFLCDVYLNFNQSIYAVLETKPNLNVLLLNAIQDDHFIWVAQEYFFQSGNGTSLEDRKKYFYCMLNLHFCNGLSILRYLDIYKYYQSHYKEYGYLIEKHILEIADDKNVILIIILLTIYHCYSNIAPEEHNGESESFWNLMKLSRQFQQFLNSKFQLIHEFFKYALQKILQHEQCYSMFPYIKPFFNVLSCSERTEMAKYISSKVQKKDRQNEYVTGIISFLEGRKSNLSSTSVTILNRGKSSSEVSRHSSNRIESCSSDDDLVIVSDA